MTKTLVALVLIAGGHLATRAGPTVAAFGRGPNLGSSTRLADMSARDVCQSYRPLAEVLLFETKYHGC